MTTYWCEACGKECTPVLRDVGPSADCCEEARLMVMDRLEPPDIAGLIPENIRQVLEYLAKKIAVVENRPGGWWFSKGLHAQRDKIINDMMLFMLPPKVTLRLLTRFEEQELAYELHDEADAERTPAERARHRVMGEP